MNRRWQINGWSGVRGRRGAFTLVELLVVVAILSLLLSMLLPSLSRSKELARRAICASNLRNTGNALNSYASESRQMLPPVGAWYMNDMMMYVMYERYGGVNPVGFNNLGYLERDGYLSMHGDMLFCPSETNSWLFNSEGDANNGNCLPWNGGPGFAPQQMVPADKDKYGWINKRSAFLRRTLGETSGKACRGLERLGGLAFLADIFNSAGHILTRHKEGVNVWYGSGRVQWITPPQGLQWPDGSYSGGHEKLRPLWEYFDAPE